MQKERKRYNITMPDDLVERVDAYGDSFYMSRSGAINALLSKALLYEDMMKDLPGLIAAMNSQSEAVMTMQDLTEKKKG